MVFGAVEYSNLLLHLTCAIFRHARETYFTPVLRAHRPGAGLEKKQECLERGVLEYQKGCTPHTVHL